MGLKNRDVARHAKVADATVSQWRDALYSPSIENFRKLAELFKVSLDFLIDGAPDPVHGPIELDVLDLLERLGPDRVAYLHTIPTEELRALVDQDELRRVRATRRGQQG